MASAFLALGKTPEAASSVPARVTVLHDSEPALPQAEERAIVRQNTTDKNADTVYLPRTAHQTLARLSPERREALRDGLLRVGSRLLDAAERAEVDPAWTRRTWPRRRYPQQCYPRTAKYVLDHPEIDGLQLVHGVASHAPLFVPFDHAWVELPGEVVFDGVVQTFFKRSSYYRVMAAVVLDAYSGPAARRLVAAQGHPGPWNARWVPTPEQLLAYAEVVSTIQDAPSVENVDRN